MKDVIQFANKYKGRAFLIIGAGGTLDTHRCQIEKFIANKNPVVIGINNMTDIHIPDYHLWTNTKRYINFGNTISEKSIPILSHKFSKKLIHKHWKKDFVKIFYTDCPKHKIKIEEKYIKGHFRTAGCLSIVMSHIFGSNDINIVGMDGYTYIKGGDVQGQHFYGTGMTDGEDWSVMKKKDDIVNRVLKNINNFGIKFKILTPTVFDKFYDAEVFGG